MIWVKYSPTNQVRANGSGSKCILKREFIVMSGGSNAIYVEGIEEFIWVVI